MILSMKIQLPNGVVKFTQTIGTLPSGLTYQGRKIKQIKPSGKVLIHPTEADIAGAIRGEVPTGWQLKGSKQITPRTRPRPTRRLRGVSN